MELQKMTDTASEQPVVQRLPEAVFRRVRKFAATKEWDCCIDLDVKAILDYVEALELRLPDQKPPVWEVVRCNSWGNESVFSTHYDSEEAEKTRASLSGFAFVRQVR